MEAKLIDINDFFVSGEGVCGNCYDCKSDPSIVVKLYHNSYPVESIYQELEYAHKVYELGIPSPEPGELVTDGQRLGLKFKRIANKRSYSTAVSQEPERVEEFAREFARINKDLHKITFPKGTFPDAKQLFKDTVIKTKDYSEAQKAPVLEFIDSIPDSINALHGDLHMGNVVSTLPKGAPITDKHDVMFIDVGYFSQGFPLIDLSINGVICKYVDEGIRREHYHLEKEKTEEFWKYFLDEYFFGPEKLAEVYCGQGATVAQVEELMQKYIALRLFLVSYICGALLPEYDKVIREAFGI